ncbi:diguanylate cyclase [Aliidongia dinghuensis]|uniref:Diguanylate cyclase n=1 Tax=Aliidongia dinghuensis TaxID=1867774 RepID=A0A8J3E1I8_9PROT|nr:ABC transporter substrate-binding protein [Aliidongia dinghuensis]GGF12414.1 diguanylate cyclase [Aliidongia dinghuensis]
MFKLRTNSGRALHPAVPALADQLAKGEIGRRDFLRTAAWLGVSAASAQAFAAAFGGALMAPGRAEAAEVPKKGGSLRFTCQIQEMKDPALVSWIEASNLYRNSLEFLTLVDADNVTHPYLALSWDPSEDLKTWRFKLRQDVKWSNGDAFNADDVVFNIKRWIQPTSKSSNRTAFAAVSDVEKTGEHEVTLHLSRPVLSIPEMLYAYTCPILHRKFEEQGADWPKNPIGTGPYSLAEYNVGQRATFKRREGYWGEPPYLDEIRYIDMGADVTSHVAALAAGQVDVLYRVTIAELDLVKRLPNVQLLTGHAAQTLCLRMQVDQKPFDDKRVRQAILLAADNQKMLDLAYRGMGVVAEDHHVAPFQPEYFKLPPLKRDVAKAKQLLADAGYKDGLDVTLTVGNTQGRWEQDTAQILQQNCAEAGVRIKLNVMPATEYWNIWNKAPFSVTYWAHRPLAVMTLDLAYRKGAEWNETHFDDPTFEAALDKALGIIDPKARSQAMEAVERSLQDAAIMVQPYWADEFTAVSAKVKDYRIHPAHYFKMDKVWLA